MIFITSHSWRIARTIASSDTVVMSSTRRRISANGRSPSALRRPSAMVAGLRLGRMRPARNERAASSAPAGSTPITRMAGLSVLAATAVPLSSPPPPTGQRMRSRSGTCVSNSTAAVPWPAITARSS